MVKVGGGAKVALRINSEGFKRAFYENQVKILAQILKKVVVM